MSASTLRSRVLPLAGAGVLAGLSALHFAWSTGSAWPAADSGRLAELVAGTDRVPSPRACVTMGVGLGVAAALVAGAGGERPSARWGRVVVAAGLLGRGLAGVTGNTHRLVPWRPGPEFVALDRRAYGPLCLVLAASAAAAATRPTGRT